MKKIILLFLITLSIQTSFFAQDVKTTVNGKVLDQDDGMPIIGVNVIEKGTTNGVLTNFDGEFSIEVSSEATLEFSTLGYAATEIEVAGKTFIEVSLQTEVSELDEVVVVGYGSVKKSDLTGSVANVSSDTYKSQYMSQVTDMLQGTVAGLNLSQGTTAAGGGDIEVRGANSLNASTQPIIVVDGAIFNGSIRDINPSDVKSIDILKDASSAAVYGSRAASGVILITTKTGTSGKTTINFTSQLGVVRTTNKLAPNNADEYITFRQDANRALNTDRPSFYFNNPAQLPEGVTIDQWRNESDNPNADNTREWLSRLSFFPIEVENFLAGNTVDWYNRVINKSAIERKYDLSISGGSEKVTYFWSMGYINNEGIIRGDTYSALTTRLNLNFKPTEWMDIGMNTQYTNRDESSVEANLFGMYRMSPYGSEFNDDGTIRRFPNEFAVENPLLNFSGQDRENRINTLFSSLYTNIKLPFGINYKLSFQPRFEFSRDYNFWSSQTPRGGQSGFATRLEFSSFNYLLDNILTWNKTFGSHAFDVTLLLNSEKNQSYESFLQNEQFTPNENLGFSGLQFGVNPAVRSNDTQSTADALMARVNYVFKDKYLLTASIRRDGYSAFGQENPRATFPALAFAWKVSDEGFFNVDAINQLKFRTSWGKNGNRDIDIYGALAQTDSDLYFDGTNTQVGVFNSTLANRALRWEKTESLNFGIDLGLFNNRINLTADAYFMKTTDLLIERNLPEITGYSSILSNLGELQNRGVEITLNTVNINSENLTWRTNLNFSLNRNKINRLFGNFDENGEELPDFTNQFFPGRAIDEIFDYNTLGIWQVDEAEAAAAVGLEPGDWKVEDVDGDGVYDELTDKQFIGFREPRFRIGMRNQFDFLKNFTAAIFLRGEFGQLASFRQALRQGGSDTYDRRNEVNIPYWTAENPINDFPRLITNTTVYGGGIQIYKSNSFVRVQNVTLSYNVPSAFLERYGITDARIFFAGNNIFTITDWPGWDPESVGDRDNSFAIGNPLPKRYSMGVSITL